MSEPETNLPDEIVPNSGTYAFWKRWGKRSDWQDKLYKKAAHKSLDIPEDDMQINANRSGIGGKAAMGIALASGLPVAVVAGMLIWNQIKEQPKPIDQPPVVAVPEVNVEPLNLKVKWWVDENGKVQSKVIEQKTDANRQDQPAK